MPSSDPPAPGRPVAKRNPTGQVGASRTPLKSIEFLVLAVLCEESLHGYGIVQQIESRTDGRVRLRPGDVYRVIYRLGERGWLEEADRLPDETGAGRRTYYAITEIGRDIAKAEAEMLAGISSPLVSETARVRDAG